MQIIKEEIGRRGLTTVAGEYSLEWNGKPDDECRPSVNDLAASVGNFTIIQSSIDIELRNPAGEVLGGGVVVVSSLAIKIGSEGAGARRQSTGLQQRRRMADWTSRISSSVLRNGVFRLSLAKSVHLFGGPKINSEYRAWQRVVPHHSSAAQKYWRSTDPSKTIRSAGRA
jgi:hypothetical protein